MDIYYEVHKGQKAILEIKNHGYLKSSEKEKNDWRIKRRVQGVFM